MGHDFIIEYKRGRDNKVSYAFSRKMEEETTTLALISFHTLVWIKELKKSYDLSSEIQGIFTLLLQREHAPNDYSLQQGLLLKKGKSVIVPSSSFQKKIL